MAEHVAVAASTEGHGGPSIAEDRLRRWLSVLRQPDKLASEEVVELLRAHGALPASPSSLAIGQAAAQLILEAIERLRPDDGASRDEVLPHEVLTTCFIEGAKLFQAAGRLGLSERQLSRERARAIALLKTELENPPSAPRVLDYLPEPIPTIRGFLERPAEMKKLHRALKDANLVVVHGPPGIGKTCLAAELAAQAAESIPVMWHRFRPGVNTSLNALLFEVGEHLRSSSAPELSQYLMGAIPAVDSALATRLAIRDLGDDKRLVVLDDYQLIEEDAAVKGLIEEMSERLPELRVVAVSRHRYLGLVEGQAVEIGPISRAQTEELLTKLGVHCNESTLRALHSWTDGNPHMLKLAASWLKSATPEEVAEGVNSLRDQAEVQEFLLSQLTNLIDPDDHEILNGASVFRNRFNDDALAHVVGSTRGAVMDSSLRLVRCYAATRNRQGDGAFFHQSVRDFVYSRIDPGEKAELHGRAAEWFERAGSPKEAAYHRRRQKELQAGRRALR